MKRILITDDSPKWVQYHETALKILFKDNISVDKAYSAKEGVEKITFSIDNPYDIIITDMQMEPDYLPLYAGEWFIKQIKFFKEYKNTKIVIISAASDINLIAEKYGTEYIPKYKCRYDNAYEKIGEL